MLPVQCKMARAALGLGVRELAEKAEVSPETVVRLEQGAALRDRTLSAIRTALEAAGVDFIAENGGGPGVRLRRPTIMTDAASPPPFAETIAAALNALPSKASEDADEPD